MPRAPKPRRTKQPVSGGLKGFATARKTKIDLLRDVQTHVVAEGVKNAGAGRESHKVHVSEIVKDACPRHLFYKVTKTTPTDPAAPAFHRMEIIWAAGNAEHDKWQRWLKEMGDLWGTWTCLLCEHTWEGLSPTECPECGQCRADLIRYDEVSLEAPAYNLVGHSDGAVPRLTSLVEVKSFSVGTVRMEAPGLVSEHTHKVDGKSIIDHEGLWAAIKRPLKSHLLQGMFYLWICEQMGLPYDKILFIYENKATQATKSFEVTLKERMLAPYLNTLTTVVEAAETGRVPARPALYVKGSKPCNVCVFRTECWGETSEASDENDPQGSAVPSRGSRPRSEEDGGEAEVRPTRAPRRSPTRRARGSDGDRGQRPRRDDDRLHPVGSAPERATGDGRGGREVGGGSDGEAARPRFARRKREGRDPD